jgi:preprotein translocase subunit YajC
MPQLGQFGPILSMVLIFAVMYFILILPQKRKDKKMREMLSSLQVGNNVTTIGGLMGKIINIKDDEVTLETSIEKTQVKLKRWAIKEVERPVEA